MLLSFHLPLADLRAFIPNSGKLLRPDWPFPFGGFVRGFGEVKHRRRGGIPDFIGEDILCDAHKAVKLGSGQVTYGGKRSRFTCRHRRLFHDGLCFTRLDIGFVSGSSSMLGSAQTECAIRNLLSTQLRYSHSHENALSVGRSIQLSGAGRHVATTYLLSTTFSKRKALAQPQWVVPGRPLVLLEYQKSYREHALPPSHARQIVLSPNLDADTHFVLFKASGIDVPVWLLAASPKMNQRDLRDLRLCITRMHAEIECLARVLGGVANGSIAPNRGSIESNNLQRYLRDSIKRLEKLLKRQREYFVDRKPIDLAVTAIENSQRGRAETIHVQAVEQLSRLDVRPSIIAATEKIQSLIHIENLNMSGDHLSNSNKTVISGSSIGSISDSFNNVAGKLSTDELKQNLDELKKHTEELYKSLPPEKAREVAKHFDKFVKEVADPKPDKSYLDVSARGLIEAANTLSMLVVPISTIVSKIITLVCP